MRKPISKRATPGHSVRSAVTTGVGSALLVLLVASANSRAGETRQAEESSDKAMSVDESLDRLSQLVPLTVEDSSMAVSAAAAASVSLEPGEIRSVPVNGVSRLAIGNPEVVDVTVVSASELLVKAKTLGRTNLLVWDQQGQHAVALEVIDRSAETTEQQLRQLITDLKLSQLHVKRERNKIFVVGEVDTQEELDRVEQMLGAFKDVTNLASVRQLAPVKTGPPRLIRLAVQVLEMSRTDLERLGVKWSGSSDYTAVLSESTQTAKSLNNTLFRIGETVSRSPLSLTLNALVEQKRARILAEPKLVTSEGKEASSFIGVEVPILTATSFTSSSGTTSVSIEYRKTGVLLKMTPTIQGEGKKQKIVTKMEAEVSDVDSSVALSVPVAGTPVLVPGFKNRKVETEFVTAPDEAVFLAGLVQAEDNSNVDQVPGLGDMPVLGRLFRSPEKKTTQRQVVIVVTPQLLEEEDTAAQDREAALEQTMTVAEVHPTIQDPTLRYAGDILQRISKTLQYPADEKSKSISGQVRLRVHVFKDGVVEQVLLAQSSGVRAFDAAAVKAAVAQAPYPPFPADLNKTDLWLDLPVIFRP